MRIASLSYPSARFHTRCAVYTCSQTHHEHFQANIDWPWRNAFNTCQYNTRTRERATYACPKSTSACSWRSFVDTCPHNRHIRGRATAALPKYTLACWSAEQTARNPIILVQNHWLDLLFLRMGASTQKKHKPSIFQPLAFLVAELVQTSHGIAAHIINFQVTVDIALAVLQAV